MSTGLLAVLASATAVGCASESLRAEDGGGQLRPWFGGALSNQFVPGVSEQRIGNENDPLHLKVRAEAQDHRSSDADSDEEEVGRRRAAAFEGGLHLGANASLEFEANLVDSLSAEEEDDPWTRMGMLFDWQRTRGAQGQVRVGLANDRIRLQSSQALSQFDEFGEGNGFESHLALGQKSEDGVALEQAIEADLVRDGDWLVSTFLRRSLVDDAFDDTGLPGGREDPRGHYQGSLSMGGTVGWGPFGLTFARETGERVRDGDGYEEENLRTTVSVGLEDLWQRTGFGSWPELAPDAVWVSLVEGDVEPAGAQTSTRDRTTDQGFGLSWAWNDAYADLSFWRYVYDGRQPNAEEADWIGHGANLGVGTYGASWKIDASLGFDLGDNQEPYSRSQDTNLYGSLSVARQPTNLPDLRLSLTLGRYKTDYVAYQGEVHTHYGEFSAEVDFSKFLREEDDKDRPTLAFLYWFRGQTMRNTFEDGQREAEQVVGLVYRMTF